MRQNHEVGAKAILKNFAGKYEVKILGFIEEDAEFWSDTYVVCYVEDNPGESWFYARPEELKRAEVSK